MVALLKKAYDQAKGLPCHERTVWELASRLGDEFFVQRQYLKAKQCVACLYSRLFLLLTLLFCLRLQIF